MRTLVGLSWDELRLLRKLIWPDNDLDGRGGPPPAQGGKKILGTTLGAEEWSLWGAADPNARDLDLIPLQRAATGCSAALNAGALDLVRRVAVVGAKAGSYGVAGLDEDNRVTCPCSRSS